MSARPAMYRDAAEAMAPLLRDGMSIGLGGFGLDRKPMALVAAIAAARVEGLRVETFAGGFDVEMLLAAGKLAHVGACHVGLDHFGLAPFFRTARQAGTLVFEEWSEFTQLAAWRAAAEKAAYAVVPLDPATGLLAVNSRIVEAPPLFGKPGGFAVEAPDFDLALLHVEAIHPDGWALTSADTYLDAILARAARTVVVSAERLIDDAELERRYGEVHLVADSVDSIVLAPGGALPGSCLPRYMVDLPAIRRYLDLAAAGGRPTQLLDLLANCIGRPDAEGRIA